VEIDEWPRILSVAREVNGNGRNPGLLQERHHPVEAPGAVPGPVNEHHGRFHGEIMPHPANREAGIWHSLRMPIDVLFAGVATADLEAAIVWYEALLGRPANVIVNDDEVMWQIRDGAWLYLLRDPSHAGHGLVTVSVPDLDQEVAEIADRGLDPPTIETIESAGRKASYFDPDGNMVSFVEVFSSDGSAQRGRTRATPAEGPLPPRSRPSRAVLRW
jgi:hypothetical protein